MNKPEMAEKIARLEKDLAEVEGKVRRLNVDNATLLHDYRKQRLGLTAVRAALASANEDKAEWREEAARLGIALNEAKAMEEAGHRVTSRLNRIIDSLLGQVQKGE